jgi:hypothetical protein
MVVSATYFKIMRIPLRKGRLVNEHDTNENLLPVVMMNRPLLAKQESDIQLPFHSTRYRSRAQVH